MVMINFIFSLLLFMQCSQLLGSGSGDERYDKYMLTDEASDSLVLALMNSSVVRDRAKRLASATQEEIVNYDKLKEKFNSLLVPSGFDEVERIEAFQYLKASLTGKPYDYKPKPSVMRHIEDFLGPDGQALSPFQTAFDKLDPVRQNPTGEPTTKGDFSDI